MIQVRNLNIDLPTVGQIIAQLLVAKEERVSVKEREGDAGLWRQ